jgi:PilZ domain
MAPERRRQRRIPVRIDAYWKNCTKAGLAQVLNLSLGGCRLVSNLPLQMGDYTVLTIYFGPGGSMTLQGRVVSTGSKGVGVRFDNMTESLKFQITEAMQSFN